MTDTKNPKSEQLTIRLLMQSKEVGSIIGKRGDHIRSIRMACAATINISEGNTPERVVTLTGTLDCLSQAFHLICKKLEEDSRQSGLSSNGNKLLVRLIVPTVHCGSIIGRSGMRIKELRETTGATVLVGSDMLPNSTERTITLYGKIEAVVACFDEICKIIMGSSAKVDMFQHRPFSPTMSICPFLVVNGQAFQLQGNYAMPIQLQELEMARCHLLPNCGAAFMAATGAMGAASNSFHIHDLIPNTNGNPMALKQLQVAALAAQQHSGVIGGPGGPITTGGHSQTKQISIANDLIGCIIGRGGQKISEIRQVSGANIKIADLEETSSERRVTITGTSEQISIAEALIQSRIASEIGGIILTQ